MSFILTRETENKPALVLATIIGTTLKYIEYTNPNELAKTLRPNNLGDKHDRDEYRTHQSDVIDDGIHLHNTIF